MTLLSRTKRTLTLLLSVGVLGISSALAATVHSEPPLPADLKGRNTLNVAERLREIRSGVSQIDATEQTELNDGGVLLTEWPNGGWGWRNGGWGWHNGGWHNGGWGWRNGGWGNGGWGNGGWPNGWHNWHNFWHNW